MPASQSGRLARRRGAATHRPAGAHGARHPYRYIDESDLRRCAIQSRCCRETGRHIAKATTAAAADFALSPSRILSLIVALLVSDSACEQANGRKAAGPCKAGPVPWVSGQKRPHSDDASSTSLNWSRCVPVQRCNLIWVKSILLFAVVLILMPGSTVGITTSFRLLACLMMFSRDRSLPHCLMICSRIKPWV